MSNDVETVTVQREKSEDNPTGLVVINKADFDEAVDKLAAAPEAEVPASVVTSETTGETTPPAAPAAPEGEAAKPWAK